MGVRTLFILILLAAAWLPNPAGAADGDDAYLIGPGDVLTIAVYDEPDLERTVTVQADGSIRFPLIRRLDVAGKSVRDVETELETQLGERFLVNPQVSVTVFEYHAKKVYVLGGVKNPGLYALTGPTTVLEIVSKAGGLNEGSSSQIILLRGAGDRTEAVTQLLAGSEGQPDAEALRAAGIQAPIVIDGHRLFDLGDTTQNKTLMDNDVVYVPNPEKVYVLGEVKRAGAVPYTDGLTLIQAISLAGGLTEMASNTIYITRKQDGKEKRIKAKYSTILKDPSKDLPLQRDDVIVVKRRIL